MASKSPDVSGGRRIQTRRSGVHGKGVFAVQDIAEGETLIEYVGEIITWKEAQRRHPHDPAHPNHTFYFHIDDDRVIDAEVRRQRRRAGSTIRATRTARPTRQDGRVFIKALRNIAAGEELNYDYGLIIDERYTPKLKAEYPCWCGAKNCRGTLLAPKRRRRDEMSQRRAVQGRRPRRSRAAPTGWPGRSDLGGGRAAAAGLRGRGAAGDRFHQHRTDAPRARRPSEPVLLVAERQTAGRGRLGRAVAERASSRQVAVADLLAGPAAGAGRLVGPVAGGRRRRGREPGPTAARGLRSSGPTTCGWTTASWAAS